MFASRWDPVYVRGVSSLLPLNRKKITQQNPSKGDPAKTPHNFVEDQYSTVSECAKVLTADGASGPQDRSLNMVECELYALAAGVPEGGTKAALPDISPYACFYGASRRPVLKVGWLDKLSPHG